MSNGLKLEHIKTYFEQHQLPSFDSSSVLYGMINAKAWQYILFSGFATLCIKHLLIYFNAEKIILIGLSLSADLTDSITVIPMTKITDLSFKKGIIRGELTFTYEQNKYSIKVPNFIVTAKWQKDNLKNILERYIIRYS
jgi:hypothetical protein